MEDARLWSLEESLWSGDPDIFARSLDEAGLMVVPAAPFILEGSAVLKSLEGVPRWQNVVLAHGRIVRPQEGLIVCAYRATAQRKGEDDYIAWCTSTWRRVAHEDWKLVQHQQMHGADGPLRGG